MTNDKNKDLERNNQIRELSSESPGVLSRRFFLSRGLASAGSLFWQLALTLCLFGPSRLKRPK